MDRKEYRRRLKKGNLPFILIVISFAMLWIGHSEHNSWTFFLGNVGILISYIWVNSNYLNGN